MDKRKAIGDTIKELRKKNHWTQAELGEKIGVSRNAVASYEQGKRAPSIEVESRICDLFDITHDQLRGITFAIDFMLRVNPNEKTMIEYYRQIPPSAREEISNRIFAYYQKFRKRG